MIGSKEKKKVGKFSVFLRFLTVFCTLFFANKLMAAGAYTCDTTGKYVECDAGFYLSDCGTDSSLWRGQGAFGTEGNSCEECPAGFICDGGRLCPAAAGIVCAAGEYIPAGTATCESCPAGYYCEGITTETKDISDTDRGIVMCPGGKYSTGGASTCHNIPAGYWSAGGAKTATPKSSSDCVGGVCGRCPAGAYCEAGSSEPAACPDGYTSTDGATARSDCFVSCPSGTAVFKMGETCTTPDGPWFTNATEKVYYGSTSTIGYCMYGAYINDDDPHVKGACAFDVPAGYQYVDSGEGLPVKYIRITNGAPAGGSANFLFMGPFGAYRTGTSINVATASMGATMETVMLDGTINRTISLLLAGGTMLPIYPGKYTTITLASEYDIDVLEFNHIAQTSNTTIPISIEVSTDGTNWTMVFNQESNPGKFNQGYKSIHLTGKPEPCSAGTYSLGETSFPIFHRKYLCQPVAGGYYSTSGAKTATPASAKDCFSGDCGLIEAGYWSAGGATSPQPSTQADCVSGECGYCVVHEGKYSEAGATQCSSCPALPTGWEYGMGLGTGYSACKIVRTPEGCAAGKLAIYAKSPTVWSPTYELEEPAGDTYMSALPGYYIARDVSLTCTPCKTGHYCTGGTSAPIACPSGYTSNSYASREGQCFVNCSAGTAVFQPGATCETRSGIWFTDTKESVYYGDHSTISFCPYGSDSMASGSANHDSKADCKTTILSGHGIDGYMNAKYVRIVGLTSGFPLAEIDFFTGDQYVNIQDKGITVTASDNITNRNNTIDNDPSTFGVVNNVATFTFSSQVQISKIEFKMGNIAGGRAVSVQVSTDNSNWTTVFNNANSLYVYGYNRDYQSSSSSYSIYLQSAAHVCQAGTYSGGGTTTLAQPLYCNPVAAGYWNNGCGTDETGGVCDPKYSGGIVAGGYWNTGCGTDETGGVCDIANFFGAAVGLGYWSAGGAKTATPKSSSDCVGGRCGYIAPGYYSAVGGMKTPTPVFGVDCTGNYEWTGQSTLSNCGRVLAGAYSTGGGSDALGRWCAGSDIGDNTCGSVAAGYYSTGGGTSATPNGPRDGCLEDYNCGLVRGGYYSTGAGMREYGSCNNRLGFMCGEIEGGYYSSAGGTSATPNGPGDGCVAGQRCGECGDANYCPNASSAPTACPTGLTTCGLGMCANEAGDCGKKLHAGDKVIHLRSEKRTTPSLNFKLGNQVFYGNLVDVIADSLRVRNGDKNYSVVSDNQ